jgi:predicted ribosome quality control (RQC) complex YloA/Tae2 family protein
LAPDWQAAGLFKGRHGASQTPKPSAKTAKLKAKLPKETTTGVLQLEPIAGWPIWVGKTATANAKISSTLANAQDIWLHVQGGPGSHVLIKAQNTGKSIPNEVLEAAAALAVWFSPFKPDGKAFVVYTLARYVKKIPGSWPGHVTYTHEKTLAVRLDNHPVQAWLDAAGRTV